MMVQYTYANLLRTLGNLSFLSWSKLKEVRDMLRLYVKIDQIMARFTAKSRLGCPAGCGQCCAKAVVAAVPAEMQPAAVYLQQTGQLEEVCAQIDPKDEQATCRFYSPENLESGGHCRIYPFRPLVCRLFGYSARTGKHGQTQLMICKIIKELDPQGVKNAQRMVNRGLKAPRSMDYFMQGYAVSPTQVEEAANLNIAFLRAAEKVALHKQLNHKLPQKEVNRMTNRNFPSKKRFHTSQEKKKAKLEEAVVQPQPTAQKSAPAPQSKPIKM